MSSNRKYRKILTASIIISLGFHAFALGCLQRYSVWFSSPKTALSIEPFTLAEKNDILKSAFETILSPSTKAVPKPILETSQVTIRSSIPVAEREIQISFNSSFSIPPHDLSPLPTISHFPSFSNESFNLLEHLPKDLIIPVATKQTGARHLPIPIASSVIFKSDAPKSPDHAPPEEPPRIQSADLGQSFKMDGTKAIPRISFPNIAKLPTLAELETSSYSDSFDAELTFLPKETGGYIFALTLIPRPELELSKIRQHFTFLIDRSNSIQQGRLTATKGAIHKALEELQLGDTFNIIAFDSKMEKMAPFSLPVSSKSFAQAEAFLEKIQLGSFFSTSDLYKPLVITVPGEVQDDELYTAILFTDGETFSKKSTYRPILQDWTRYNGGKVTLHALAVNGDAHLSTLDAATAFNRGKLLNAPTNRSLKRKLLKLLKMIQNPVGKNITCTGISATPNHHLILFPQSSQLPPLYLDQPYVILGETETLDDFILFVQGRLKDRWLNIRKTISFVNGKKGGKELKEEWALQSAYLLYENYLQDANPKHLVKAERLLEPFNHQSAFR